MTLHAWDWGTDRPVYLCGKAPTQSSGGTTTLMLNSTSAPSLRRAAKYRNGLCRNCARALARLERAKGGGR